MIKLWLVWLVAGVLVSMAFSACVPIGEASSRSPAATNTRVFATVNPRPRVVVEGEAGKYAVDLGTIPDEQSPGTGLNVIHFRKSLTSGFQNMLGASYTDQVDGANMVLAIELAELSRANIGQIGGYIIIRYRATWRTGKGTQVASLVGVAEPRNPTEPGPRHLEDVIEVMYEEMVQGLERAQGIKTR